MARGILRDFYVYVLFRPNGVPCYVGKGRGQRWKRRDRHKRNPHLASIIRLAGGELPTVIVREGMMEAEAFATEIAFIKAIGREPVGPLVNLTDGGEGTAGAVMNAAWRLHRKAEALRLWSDPAYRAMMRDKKLGNKNSKKPHKLSDEWLAELTAKMTGNTFTLGLRHTETARQKMSLAGKGKPKPPFTKQHKANIGAAVRRRSRQLSLFDD